MNKLLIIFSILFALNVISKNVLAKVNIDLLKQKYPKCEDVTYRHECFDENLYSVTRKIGYYRNNILWEGLEYQNNILIIEHKNGKIIYKSFCKETDNGWTTCPSGNKYKPIDTGYFDKKNRRQGKFIYEYKSGNVYVGEYKEGRKHGQGTFTWESGERYLGEWENGYMSGQGVFTWADGRKYVGEWQNDYMHGQGKYTYANGKVKEGIWKDNKFMYVKKPTSTSNSKIEEYKSFCSEIGFTLGTEKFGECVVEAMKKG